MNDDELEQAMRGGLERRAERAEVDPLVVERARADARGRRTTRWAVLGAAAAVVAVVGVGAVVVDRDDPAAPPTAGRTTTATEPTSTAPTPDPRPARARTEAWHGVEVTVPDDWGHGNPTDCGEVPDGEPYVGRPIGVTDACTIFDPDLTPTAPYLWFDVAGVPVGTQDLGDGWTRTTVEVEGVAISVASDDDGQLLDLLLSSARPVTGCAASLDAPPEPRYESTFEGVGEVQGGRVCAYRSREGGGYDLVYGSDLTVDVIGRTARAVERAEQADRCREAPFEVVVLTAAHVDPQGPEALERDLVYDLTCGVVRQGRPFGEAPVAHLVTEATVPWAGGVFRQLLTGPSEAWAYGYFIGMQG